MGSMIAKLVIFSILLNLAGGVMMTVIVDVDGDPIFSRTSTAGYSYNNSDDYSSDFESELSETIKPSGSVEDEGDQVYRVLDTLSLGFIYKFINVIDTYMFGFVNMMDNIMGQYMEDDARVVIFGNEDDTDNIPNKFGVFKLVITISYILMGIQLFTGKSVVEG